MRREPNISRFDYGRTHGWWVRFQRGTTAEGRRIIVSKMFSDAVHGGNSKALGAAIAWRNRTVLNVPSPMRTGIPELTPGTGYVRRTEIRQRSGNTSDVWVAWIRLDGGPKSAASTSRSVAKWGVRGAKLEAERWREQQRQQLKRALRGRME